MRGPRRTGHHSRPGPSALGHRSGRAATVDRRAPAERTHPHQRDDRNRHPGNRRRAGAIRNRNQRSFTRVRLNGISGLVPGVGLWCIPVSAHHERPLMRRNGNAPRRWLSRVAAALPAEAGTTGAILCGREEMCHNRRTGPLPCFYLSVPLIFLLKLHRLSEKPP